MTKAQKSKRYRRSKAPQGRALTNPALKRVRKQHVGSPLVQEQAPTQKRRRSSRLKRNDSIEHWRKEGTWPKEYLEPDSQLGEKFRLRDAAEVSQAQHEVRSDVVATPPLSITAAARLNRRPREVEQNPYLCPHYPSIMVRRGSTYMDEFELGNTDESKALCQQLLNADQTVPGGTLFSDDRIESTLRNIRNKSKSRVIRDLSLLIVPSAEQLTAAGAEHLHILIESVDESWSSSVLDNLPNPHPDYSVGFRREAFTDVQLKKLDFFIGNIHDIRWGSSHFTGTLYEYFPFLTCEVGYGITGIELADRRNLHSMTIAVRCIVKLFRLARRDRELSRQILAFSISYDHKSVRIWGHYPVVDEISVRYFRHPIHQFTLSAGNCEERWTAYKFVKNVYDIWMPTHFRRIGSVIDDLPSNLPAGLSFEPPEKSDLRLHMATTPSQELEHQPATGPAIRWDNLDKTYQWDP